MAAYFLSKVEDIKEQLRLCWNEIGTGEETAPFWRFVAGLLDSKKLTTMMAILCSQGTKSRETRQWILFKMSCLAEAVQQRPASSAEEDLKLKKTEQAAAVSLSRKLDFRDSALSVCDIHSVSVAL